MKRIALVTLILFAALQVSSQTIPQYTGYVNDFANILSPQTEAVLTKIISQYEHQSSIEIAIVTIDDIQRTYIEDYSIKLAEKWKVGKKGLDNGLILLLSIDTFDRGFRIEVGYGLEGRMTDYNASGITRETVQKYFKQGKFDEGMRFALDQTISVLGPESQEQWKAYQAKLEKEREENLKAFVSTAWSVLIFISFTGLIVGIVWLAYRYLKQKEMERLEKERQEKVRQDLRRKTYTKTKLVLERIAATRQVIESLKEDKFPGADNFKKRLDLIGHAVGSISIPETASVDQIRITQNTFNERDRECNYLAREISEALETRHTILNGKKKFSTLDKKLDRLTETNKQIEKELRKSNPPSIWRFPDWEKRAWTHLGDATTQFNTAVAYVNEGKYSSAKKGFDLANSHYDNAIRYAKYPSELSKEIAYSKKEFNKTWSTIDRTIARAKKSVLREHVSNRTKKMVDEIHDRLLEVKKETRKSNVDWIVLLALLLAFISYLDGIEKAANSDIEGHFAAIRRREEEKRAAERRRREEEEEEERQRRRRNSSSSYSSGGWGSSSSSGGSSFGGGSFGGGGSTSRW